MFKLILIALLFVTTIGLADSYQQVDARQPLRILNWVDYISPEILDIWYQRTGIMVEQIYYDSEKVRDGIIFAKDTMGIDLVMLDDVAAEMFSRTGDIRAFNPDKLNGYANHRADWRERCGEKAVPYLWGTLGIAYRGDKFDTPPSSWRELMEPSALTHGHIGMMDGYIDALAPQLFIANASILTEDEALLREAYNALSKQSNAVLTYDYAISFLQADARADQLHIALVFSGDETSLNEVSGVENLWKFVVPKEGTAVWVDCLAILQGAAQPELAVAFLGFLNEPEIAALNAERNGNATTNLPAQRYLSDEFKSDIQFKLDPATTADIQQYGALSEANTLIRERIIQSVISQHDAH